jgi:hypothetical protein
MPLLSPICVTCPAHLILLDFITLKILGEQYRSLSSSLCSFIYSPVTSSLLRPNTLLKTLFSNTLSLGSSLNAYRGTVLHILPACTIWTVSRYSCFSGIVFSQCECFVLLKDTRVFLGLQGNWTQPLARIIVSTVLPIRQIFSPLCKTPTPLYSQNTSTLQTLWTETCKSKSDFRHICYSVGLILQNKMLPRLWNCWF